MEGNYQNSELIFSYLDLLYDHTILLYVNRDLKIQECINKTEERHRQAIDALFFGYNLILTLVRLTDIS